MKTDEFTLRVYQETGTAGLGTETSSISSSAIGETNPSGLTASTEQLMSPSTDSTVLPIFEGVKPILALKVVARSLFA